MEKEDFEKEVETEYSTAGHNKIIRYIEEVVNTKPFQEEIVHLRKEYKIPTNGFTGDLIFPPKDWVYNSLEESKKLDEEIKKLCQKYHIHYMDAILLLEPYIFYNELDLKDIIYERGAFNLLYVADLAMEAEEPYSKEFQDSDNLAYPVAVRISPYASLRDILDFVKKVYKHSILPLQNQYKIEGVKIGKNKKRKDFVKERNELIYQNRHLPSKEIMHIVYEKYGPDIEIDQGYIGKIISMEKKKRKDV